MKRIIIFLAIVTIALTANAQFINNTRTFIPDGPYCSALGNCVTIGNVVSGYPSGRQLLSPEDILSVCINMEHSFMGDLQITLYCPSYSESDTTGHGKAVLKYHVADSIPQGTMVPDGTWGGSTRYMGIPYGGSSNTSFDASASTGHQCDSLYNPYGLGFEYCFSRNSSRTLINGYPADTPLPYYAGLASISPEQITYTFPPIPAGFDSAGYSCGTVTSNNTVPASNREEGTGFYVPASDFMSLVGCPFNGEWQIKICDYFGTNNGWVFNWSIDFGSHVYAYAQDSSLGTVNGGGLYNSNTEVQVSATPHSGIYFLGWSDGTEDNPYTLTVNYDTTLVAYFAEHDDVVINDTIDTFYIYDTIYRTDTITIHDTIYITQEGVVGADALNAKVYFSNGKIVVEGADGNRVTLYDVNGRMLATKQDKFTPLRFDAPVNGTYLIKIGNYPARKVVVIR